VHADTTGRRGVCCTASVVSGRTAKGCDSRELRTAFAFYEAMRASRAAIR
jgi:hypothetical protein